MSEVIKVMNENGNSQQCQVPHKDTQKCSLGIAFWKALELFYGVGSSIEWSGLRHIAES